MLVVGFFSWPVAAESGDDTREIPRRYAPRDDVRTRVITSTND